MARKHPDDEPAPKPIFAESAIEVLCCRPRSAGLYLGSLLFLAGHLRHSRDCLETLGTALVPDSTDLLKRQSARPVISLLLEVLAIPS